ncbi:MAG: D-arabinono-1,4-lactone oxidase [Janthinobacterium lividum]
MSPGSPNPRPSPTFFRRSRRKLRPFSSRPHWAKVNTLSAEQISPLYPRFNDFKQLVRHYDPTGKFSNAYMHQKLFG